VISVLTAVWELWRFFWPSILISFGLSRTYLGTYQFRSHLGQISTQDRSYLGRTKSNRRPKIVTAPTRPPNLKSAVTYFHRNGTHMASKSEIAVTYIQILIYYSILVLTNVSLVRTRSLLEAGFRPVSLFGLILYHYFEQNGAFELVPAKQFWEKGKILVDGFETRCFFLCVLPPHS